MNLTVIIPTLNEGKNISLLISKLKKAYPKINIVVVDDGSTDNTIQKAKETSVHVIDRKNSKVKGITASVIDSVNLIKTKRFIVMDADFQHPPEKIKDIVKKLKKYDLVIAVRKSLPKKWEIKRKIQSSLATKFAKIRVGNIKDPLSGFFGMNTQKFRELNKNNFQLDCFKILFNILKNYKGKKSYVYYNFQLRNANESKLKTKQIISFAKSLVRI